MNTLLEENVLLDGRYKIKRLIKKDEYECLYEAVHERIGKSVVVRALNCLEEKEAFLSEARFMSAFGDTKGIWGVLDFFEEGGKAYVVMDGVSEDDLCRHYEERSPIAAEELVRTLLPFMEGVRLFHKNGSCYRFLTPEAVVKTLENEWKLVGFRKAFIYEQEDMASDDSCAPWEAQDEEACGPWTDVYAVCAILYRGLTGQNVPQGFLRPLLDELKMPSELGIQISPEFEAILCKGLAVSCEDRYQDMETFLNAICEWLPASETKKRRFSWKVITGISVICLLAGGFASTGVYYNENKEKFKFRDIETQTVTLAPDDEMSANDYYAAAEVIRDRMVYLAGTDNFILETENDRMEIIAPREVYGEKDVVSYVENTMASPLKVSLGAGYAYENFFVEYLFPETFFELSREDIISIDIFDLSEPVELSGEIIEQGVTFELSEAAADRFREMYQEVLSEPREETEYVFPAFAVDLEKNGIRNYSCHMEEDYHFCSIYLTDEMEECLPFLTEPTFEARLNVFCEIPVEWETNNLSEGKNQRSADKISNPCVYLKYACSAEDAESMNTDSAFYRLNSVFQSKLDLLGVPYAIGSSEDKSIIVKIAQKNISLMLAETIGSSWLQLYDEYDQPLVYYDIEGFRKNDDGEYEFAATIDEGFEKYRKDTLAQSEKVFLVLTGTHGECYVLMEEDWADCVNMENQTIVLKNSKVGNSDTFSDKQQVFFDLLDYNSNGTRLPVSYSLYGVQFQTKEHFVDIEMIEENMDVHADKYEPISEM